VSTRRASPASVGLSALLALASGVSAEDEGPGPVPVAEAVALARGTSNPLRKDGESAVDAGAAFRVVAAVPLSDARLALYDAQDALLPVAERTAVGSTATQLEVQPARRLAPGRYSLRLEGATGREMHDLSGRSYRPVTFALAVASPGRP
jgi:hypothetical protein